MKQSVVYFGAATSETFREEEISRDTSSVCRDVNPELSHAGISATLSKNKQRLKSVSGVWHSSLIRINWFLIASLVRADQCFGVVSPRGLQGDKCGQRQGQGGDGGRQGESGGRRGSQGGRLGRQGETGGETEGSQGGDRGGDRGESRGRRGGDGGETGGSQGGIKGETGGSRGGDRGGDRGSQEGNRGETGGESGRNQGGDRGESGWDRGETGGSHGVSWWSTHTHRRKQIKSHMTTVVSMSCCRKEG